jgi:hypothetical protein
MIIQFNIYSCDICLNIIKETLQQTSVYSDPVVEDVVGLLTYFTKFDDHGRKYYSGYACNNCVDKFGVEGEGLEYFRVGES